MHKDDSIRLQHILDAAREAIGFARGRARADLDRDRMFVLALVKEIEIIGEAANQISEATMEQLPDIPWADIIGMRNRLVIGHKLRFKVLCQVGLAPDICGGA